MSIVGPRPLAVIYLDYYNDEEKKRHGTKYYEIRNDGFEFKFLEGRISIPPLYTQQFESENLSFGYELSVYSDVADRLFWFNVISEIVNASTIIIKFGAADEERIRLLISIKYSLMQYKKS